MRGYPRGEFGRGLGGGLFVAAAMLTASEVSAHVAVGIAGPSGGTFFPVGASIGCGFGRSIAESSGLTLGLEGSIAHMTRDTVWFGGYVDALHDFAASEQRFSIGPELGFAVFGVDGGLLIARSHGEPTYGFTVRPMLAFAIVDVYYRYGRLVSGTRDSFGEAGVLLKFPIEH